MRNTKALIHQNTKTKFTFIMTLLASTLLSATSHSAIVPATELVEIEAAKQSSLYQEAQESLALSFSQLAIEETSNNDVLNNTIANKKNSTPTDAPITLTKVNLVSE